MEETFARLLQARPRLDDDALAPFAVVLARNVAVSFVRSRHTEKRHLHRLVDLREPDRPEERALQQEEVRAIAEGLARLPARDRTALVANEEGATPPPLPQSSGRHPGPWSRSWRGRGPSSGSTISWPSAPSTCRPTAASRSSTPVGRGSPPSARPRCRRAPARLQGVRGLEQSPDRTPPHAGWLPPARPGQARGGCEAGSMTIHDHPGQATVAGTGSLVVGALLATQLLAADPTECGRPRRHRPPSRRPPRPGIAR